MARRIGSRAHERGRRDGFLRRHPGLPDRAGDGAAAAARRLRADRRRADGAGSGAGPRDSRAARSDLARRAIRFRCCSDRATSICARRRRASSARSTSRLRATAGIVAPIGGDLAGDDLPVRPAGARRRAVAPSGRAGDASPTQPARATAPRLRRHRALRARRLGAARQRAGRTAGRPPSTSRRGAT